MMEPSNNFKDERKKRLCDTVVIDDSFDESESDYQACITRSDFDFEVSFEESNYSHNVSDLTVEESFSSPQEKMDKSFDPEATEMVKTFNSTLLEDDNPRDSGITQLQQTVWEISYFKHNLPRNLDSESSDGTEMCPLRTAFFENGESIGLPTKYIGNLYLKEWSDENKNVNMPNRNLKQQEGDPGKDLLIEVHMKLVEIDDSIAERLIYTNFKARVHSLSTGVIATMGTPIFLHKLRHSTSSSVKVRWNLLKDRLGPEDSLFVSIDHFVYRSPSEWGLNPRHELIVKKFSENGKVDAGNVQEILKMCEEQKRTALAETLKAAGFAENKTEMGTGKCEN